MLRFFWSGASARQHMTPIAREVVTKPKSKGGLGIKRLLKWNKEAILKHVWQIIIDERGNIWLDWARKNLRKDANFWLAKALTRCLWTW